jgi:hypothetical protein
MSDLIQVIGDSNCGDCSQSIKIKGCANNVPYLQIVTSTGISPATVTFINLIDGVISATAPVGYATGDCPAYEEVDLVKTNWLPICVAGVQWYVLESSTYNNATLTETTPVKLYKQGANGAVVTTAPVGTIVDGTCVIPTQQTLQSGGVSIASGTLAGTLGPDGTIWNNPGNLRSVTVRARRSNTSNAVPGSGSNQVMVQTTNNKVILFTNESATWSVEDGNIQDFVYVECLVNSAALVIYNFI